MLTCLCVQLYDWRRPQDVTATAGPYVSQNLQVVKSRLGTGLWAFEDLNRALETHSTGNRTFVYLTDVGKVAYFDRRLSRHEDGDLVGRESR